MNRALSVIALSSSILLSCRTVLTPTPAVSEAPVVPRDRTECDVRDYPSATDIPNGAKNIGWVQVPRAETDEQTYINLRKAICDKGGDALSQLLWVREVNVRQPVGLRANAWVLP